MIKQGRKNVQKVRNLSHGARLPGLQCARGSTVRTSPRPMRGRCDCVVFGSSCACSRMEGDSEGGGIVLPVDVVSEEEQEDAEMMGFQSLKLGEI